MKISIKILGSTGSIGLSALKIIDVKKKLFKINLLSANKNCHQLMKQAKEFNVKNVIISDYENYNKIKNDKKYKIWNSC